MTLDAGDPQDRRESLRSGITRRVNTICEIRKTVSFRDEYENLSKKRGFEDFQLVILGLFTVSNVYTDLYRQNVFGAAHIFDVLSVTSVVVLAVCYYLLAVEVFLGTYCAIKAFTKPKKPIAQGSSSLRKFLVELSKMAADALMLIASIPALRILRSLRTLFIFTHLERITQRNSVQHFVEDKNATRPLANIVDQSDYTRVGSKRFLFLLAYSCILVLISVSDSIFQAEAVPLFHGSWPLVSDPLKPDSVKSFADALWYSVNDLTTVGCQYNVYTLSGRALAVLLIVLGFTLLALLTNFFMRILLSVFSNGVNILGMNDLMPLRGDKDSESNRTKTDGLTTNEETERLSSVHQE